MIPSGLKITQFSLLRNIGRAGEINVTELAEKLQLERTAMGRNLDLLERRGLIRTGSAESDQRTRLVRLTAAGKKARDAALPIWRRAQTEMRRRLGDPPAVADHAQIANHGLTVVRAGEAVGP